jgi:hypothetical protein
MGHLSTGTAKAATRARAARAALVVAALAAAGVARAGEQLDAAYLFRLADVSGAIPMSWAGLSYDRAARELYVNDRGAGQVRVFRDSGMQVQAFGGDEAFGTILDVAVAADGDLFVLAYRDRRTIVLRCDFRGEPRGEIAIPGVADAFAGGFEPAAIRFRDGKLYLADKERLRILVADARGATIAARDLLPSLRIDPKKRESARMTGFDVDGSGNLLFTIGPLFSAFVVSPSGAVRAFGSRGSTPGRFNVAGAIAADEHGYLYVTDVLRAVVMVFTPSLEFVGEFGYRGDEPGNLVTPVDVAVHGGRVFVAEGAMRGVSVFRVAVREAAREGSG